MEAPRGGANPRTSIELLGNIEHVKIAKHRAHRNTNNGGVQRPAPPKAGPLLALIFDFSRS
jgi:hypothetical protein